PAAIGVVSDRLALAEGNATSIVEHRSAAPKIDEVTKKIREIQARVLAGGGGSEGAVKRIGGVVAEAKPWGSEKGKVKSEKGRRKKPEARGRKPENRELEPENLSSQKPVAEHERQRATW